MISHVRGSFDIPLVEKTLGQAFDEAVERWSDREALVSCHEDIRWTWTQLGQRVDNFAKGLWSLGFRPGNRLGVWATNQADWSVAQFATSKVGVILVNINPAYRPSELEYVLKKVGCKGLVTGDHFKSSNYIAMLQEVVPELNHTEPGSLQSERIPSLELVIRLGEKKTPGMMNFSEVVDLGEAVEDDLLRKVGESIDPFDPINIQFTSGTTGAPKGATLSHHNILNNAKIIGDTLRYTSEDRICISVPLYHCFGMVAGNLPALTHGATMVYPGEVFEPLSILRAVEQERCTSMYGVPTMYFAVIDHPDVAEYDVTSLRTGIMAGAPCPMELMKDAVEKLHMPEITIGYGMTETSPISFQSRVDDPMEKRVGTVGRVCPHTETKIVDEEGNIVPRGTPGRDSHQRLSRDEGLLERRRENRERDLQRWLDPHR